MCYVVELVCTRCERRRRTNEVEPCFFYFDRYCFNRLGAGPGPPPVYPREDLCSNCTNADRQRQEEARHDQERQNYAHGERRTWEEQTSRWKELIRDLEERDERRRQEEIHQRDERREQEFRAEQQRAKQEAEAEAEAKRQRRNEMSRAAIQRRKKMYPEEAEAARARSNAKRRENDAKKRVADPEGHQEQLKRYREKAHDRRQSQKLAANGQASGINQSVPTRQHASSGLPQQTGGRGGSQTTSSEDHPRGRAATATRPIQASPNRSEVDCDRGRRSQAPSRSLSRPRDVADRPVHSRSRSRSRNIPAGPSGYSSRQHRNRQPRSGSRSRSASAEPPESYSKHGARDYRYF